MAESLSNGLSLVPQAQLQQLTSKPPGLRPYQEEYKKYFYSLLKLGKRKVMIVMPTGTGKTTVFSSIARDLQTEMPILFVVHRIELVEQIYERLKSFELDPGLIANGFPLEPEKRIQVSSVMSLASLDYKVTPGLIIIDECHHSPAETYLPLFQNFPEAKVLGVTATPVRLDGKGFDDLYEEMIDLYPVSWFIQNGFLAKPKHYQCANIDIKKFKMVGNEFNSNQLALEMRQEKKLANIVTTYLKYAYGQKVIVFAQNIPHSYDIVARFNEQGIPAAHLDGEMSSGDRARIIEKYKKGLIKVISNYDIVSEGFDVPDTDATILGRLTNSLSLYIQMCGRCLRPDKATGKRFGYVLDCAGNWQIHGLAGIDYTWSLESNKEELKKDIKTKSRIREFEYKPAGLPTEIEDVDLVALNEDLTRLSFFDELNERNTDPFLAVEEYCGSLVLQEEYISELEILYIKDRLKDKNFLIDDEFLRRYKDPKIQHFNL